MATSPLQPVLWLLAILLLYGSVGVDVVLIYAASCTRRAPLIALSVLILLAGVGMILFAPFAPQIRMIGVGAFSLVVSLAFYRLALRPAMDWQMHKASREAARQTMLHLILATGAILFMVPFAWLVVTSLKEDKEMSQFPPVWIPTQQVKREIEGKPRGLATTNYQGQKVTVAVMEEMDTGERTLLILKPPQLAGTRFNANKTTLKDIRHFAPVWRNYPDALNFLPPDTDFGLVFLRNTITITILSIIGTLLSSSMVAYSFARLRWPGRDTLFLALLGTMMLPGAVTMMPVFLIYRWIGWIDTLQVLWVGSFFGSAFNIFLLRQFFLSIPTELEDAAKIDGCSFFGIYWRIMLPQIKPALAALTILTFMGAWNDFRGPLIYISSQEKEPLAYALQLFQTAHSGEPGMMMAASTLVMVPVLVLFFFTQRYFIEGITLTGIKG